MRICRHVSVILVIVISTILYADEKEHKEGLQEILPQFTSAWNKAQVSDFMALFHPDSRLKKSYDTDQRMKRYIDMSFAQMFFVFGEVTNSQIRQYIERKRRFVVHVTYKNKGMIPGTFAVKQYNDKWLIDDFNPDGQLALAVDFTLEVLNPQLPFHFGRLAGFSGTFLIAWAALFELGGPLLASWDGETLSEIIHPKIFQILFVPGTFLVMCAVLS